MLLGSFLGFMVGTVLSTLVSGNYVLTQRLQSQQHTHLPDKRKPTTAPDSVASSSSSSSESASDSDAESGLVYKNNVEEGSEESSSSSPLPSPPAPRQGHMSLAKLTKDKGGLVMDPEEFLPYTAVDATTSLAASTASCMQNGMQQKCHFTNLVVKNNVFSLIEPKGRYPNPIYPADGQISPLKKYHKYTGHKIRVVQQQPAAQICERIVTRPTLFFFRMSGHSPYHLWENNLGPFHKTLQDFAALKEKVNDVTQLLVAFVDKKPVKGPKAPYLLDILTQSFTDLPLINASRIAKSTCFSNAIVGVAANHFDHRSLIKAMWMHLAGKLPPPLPKIPKVVFVSRNHPSVIRGRKISNEPEVVKIINETVIAATGQAVEYVHMQDYSYQEQVTRTVDTQIIIGPHGAGIANCIWMQKGAVVMEMASPYGKTLFNLYHSMCKRSDVSHLSFVAEHDPADLKVWRKGDLEKRGEKKQKTTFQLPDSAFQDNKRLYSNLMVPVEMMEENTKRALALYTKVLSTMFSSFHFFCTPSQFHN